jgi:hypothetical protein
VGPVDGASLYRWTTEDEGRAIPRKVVVYKQGDDGESPKFKKKNSIIGLYLQLYNKNAIFFESGKNIISKTIPRAATEVNRYETVAKLEKRSMFMVYSPGFYKE